MSPVNTKTYLPNWFRLADMTMQSNPRNIFIQSLLMAWLILALLAFVYVSRTSYVPIVTIPGSSAWLEVFARIPLLSYLINLSGALLGILLFSLACLSLGLGILGQQITSQPSRLATGVTAFLVGEILFSLVFLTLISLYRLTPILVVLTCLPGFFLGFPALRSFVPPLRPNFSFSGFDRTERVVLILGVIALLLSLLLSGTRIGYDAAAEYFSHAKIMAVSHSPIFFYPKDFFVVSSFHPGILFTGVIELFGDQSARLLSWVNGLAILLMGLALGQELGLSRRAGLWFLTLMVTSTAFVDLLGDGKIELISTAPILGAIYWAVRSSERPTKGTFLLIGLLAGFAIIARPYNIFLVSSFIAFIFISQAFIEYRARRFDFRRFVQSMLWMTVTLVILGAFHLLQNWIWLGDPLAPLTYGRDLQSSDWQWQLDPQNLMVYRLFYPLILTFLNSPQSLGNISPLLIGCLPFLLLKPVRNNVHFTPMLGHLTILAALTLLLWITLFFTVLEIRYVLFLWVILFIAAAQVLESATQQVGRVIYPLFSSFVIIFLAIMGIRILLIALTGYLPHGTIRRSDCHDTRLCDFVATINEPAAPGTRVLVLHGYRYYLRPDLFACSSQVQEYALLEPLARQNSSEFWVEAYRQGYQFIMFEQHLSEERYHFGKLPDLDTVPNWLTVKTLYASPTGNQLIYELGAVDPPIQHEISCQQDSAGVWQVIPSVAPGH